MIFRIVLNHFQDFCIWWGNFYSAWLNLFGNRMEQISINIKSFKNASCCISFESEMRKYHQFYWWHTCKSWIACIIANNAFEFIFTDYERIRILIILCCSCVLFFFIFFSFFPLFRFDHSTYMHCIANLFDRRNQKLIMCMATPVFYHNFTLPPHNNSTINQLNNQPLGNRSETVPSYFNFNWII